MEAHHAAHFVETMHTATLLRLQLLASILPDRASLRPTSYGPAMAIATTSFVANPETPASALRILSVCLLHREDSDVYLVAG